MSELYKLIKENHGKNLKMKSDIPISRKMKTLLQSLLELDPEKRISWNSFFNHEIFKDHLLSQFPKSSKPISESKSKNKNSKVYDKLDLFSPRERFSIHKENYNISSEKKKLRGVNNLLENKSPSKHGSHQDIFQIASKHKKKFQSLKTTPKTHDRYRKGSESRRTNRISERDTSTNKYSPDYGTYNEHETMTRKPFRAGSNKKIQAYSFNSNNRVSSHDITPWGKQKRKDTKNESVVFFQNQVRDTKKFVHDNYAEIERKKWAQYKKNESKNKKSKIMFY